MRLRTTDGVSYTEASEGHNALFVIPNTFGASLPNSGGIGTTIFYVLGSVLLLSSLIFFAARRMIV